MSVLLGYNYKKITYLKVIFRKISLNLIFILYFLNQFKKLYLYNRLTLCKF